VVILRIFPQQVVLFHSSALQQFIPSVRIFRLLFFAISIAHGHNRLRFTCQHQSRCM
jgi:hypothetical protein